MPLLFLYHERAINVGNMDIFVEISLKKYLIDLLYRMIEKSNAIFGLFETLFDRFLSSNETMRVAIFSFKEFVYYFF